MKKFAQTAIVIAGLAGLSACASDRTDTYNARTANSGTTANALNMCQERENRLLAMNKSCYRK